MFFVFCFFEINNVAFEYKNDSVLMVEKWDYYHCNSSDPILALDNGKGIIKLDRSGPFYFISGFPDHCKNGQRLLVQVISPPLTAPPPDSYVDSAPSPSSHNAGASVPVTEPAMVVVVMAAFALTLFF